MSKPNEAPRAANMYDVARLAGVSHQTVSRVINENASVSDSTREKVQAAMAQLNYRPNRAARSLATSRTKLLGVLASDTGQFGPASLMHAIEHSAREAGYFAVASSVDGQSRDSIAEGMTQLLELGVEALIVVAPQAAVLDVAKSLSMNLPMVTIDSSNRMDVFTVAVDNYSGARLAVRHLIEAGHKQILHICGPVGWVEAEARVKGYRDELQAHGLEVVDVVQGDWSSQTGWVVGQQLAKRINDFTGIFVANDHMVLGLLHAFKDAGISVPGDVSVVGFDDLPDAAHFAPPLTTIRQNFHEVGRRAVALLLDELTGVESIRHEQIVPQLVKRDSVAAPSRKL